MDRIGKIWTIEEDMLLKKLYNVDCFDVIKISKIHSRNVGGIVARLKKLNIINNTKEYRGAMNVIKNNEIIKNNNNNINKYSYNIFFNKLDIINDNIQISINNINKHLDNILSKIVDYELFNIKYNELLTSYNDLLIENNKLKDNLKNINDKCDKSDDYGIISINNIDYYLIDNEVYKIKNIKGELFAYYDIYKNKIKKI